MLSSGRSWGTEPSEQTFEYPCDSLLGGRHEVYYRAVSVDAPPALLYRWLCQIRKAPYSYDWIDNFGRRSPQQLIAGLDALSPGQSIMSIFELTSFERDRHLTVRLRGVLTLQGLLGDCVVTYLILPQPDQTCRLVVKLLIRYPGGPAGWIPKVVLPWVDLFMMRKQLLNLKGLAERDARLAG